MGGCTVGGLIGDASILKRLFAGEMYANNKTLLKKTGHLGFSRNHYRGTIFRITEVSRNDEGVMADFTTLSADRKKEAIYMLLTRHEVGARHDPTGSHSLKAKQIKWPIIKHVKVK